MTSSLPVDLAIDNPTSLDAVVDVARLHEYFGVWAIQEEPFLAAVDRVQGMDVQAHVRNSREKTEFQASARGRGYETTDQVAVIDLAGSLMKTVSSMSEGTSTILARRAIRNAVADPDVSAILLRIDSPGGTVAGTKDLAEDVAAAARQKPLVAYIEDLGASAAYWVASQARSVYANATALVGSIGTFAVLQDLSGRAAQLGIKVHVIRAGAFKGSGTPGTEVTAEQLANWQRLVTDLNEHFLAGVAAGRKLSLDRVRELADGRVHVGAQAQALGLIDAVKTFDEAIAELRGGKAGRARAQQLLPVAPAATSPSTNGGTPVSQETTPGTDTLQTGTVSETPASYHELTQACVGADSAFLCQQLDKKATVTQATQAWMAEQNRRLEASRQELQQSQAAARKPGVKPLGTTSQGGSTESAADPVAEFGRLVQERMDRGQSRVDASAAVARANPDLHQAFLLATNQGARLQRLITEKFG